MSALINHHALTVPTSKQQLVTQQLFLSAGEELGLTIDKKHEIVLFVQSGYGQLLNHNGEMYSIEFGSSFRIPAGVAYGIWNEHKRLDLVLILTRSPATALQEGKKFSKI